MLEFVNRLIETFDTPIEPLDSGDTGQQQQVNLDLSLKLRIFSSLLVEIGASEDTSSSETSEAVPALVAETIEAIATEQDPRLEALA